MSEDVSQEDLVEDIGFNDESIRSNEIELYKGRAGYTDRIGIVSDKVKKAKIHYRKGMGYVLCRSKPAKKDAKGVVVEEAHKALCCKKLGAPKVRCGVVIAHYHTNKQGDIDPNHLGYTLKVWIFGEDKYSLIRSYNAEMPIDKNDIKIMCTDAEYQKIQFMPAKDSLWRKPQLGWVDEIHEEAATMGEKVPRLLGKVLTDDEILESLGEAAGAAAAANSVGSEKDIDSVLEGIV